MRAAVDALARALRRQSAWTVELQAYTKQTAWAAHIPAIQGHIDAFVVNSGPSAYATVRTADNVWVAQLDSESASHWETRVVRANVVGNHGHDTICTAKCVANGGVGQMRK